jgi:hypothetical protein
MSTKQMLNCQSVAEIKDLMDRIGVFESERNDDFAHQVEVWRKSAIAQIGQ